MSRRRSRQPERAPRQGDAAEDAREAESWHPAPSLDCSQYKAQNRAQMESRRRPHRCSWRCRRREGRLGEVYGECTASRGICLQIRTETHQRKVDLQGTEAWTTPRRVHGPRRRRRRSNVHSELQNDTAAGTNGDYPKRNARIKRKIQKNWARAWPKAEAMVRRWRLTMSSRANSTALSSRTSVR